MAALSLTGLVFLGARALLDQLADARERIRHEGALDAARANGETLLHALVSRAQAGTDSSDRFMGVKTGATFVTWCESSGGWLERCLVGLTVSVSEDSSSIHATIDGGMPEKLWSRREAASLTFLDLRAGTPTWSDIWQNAIVTPAAVGIAFDADTVVLRIGAGR